MKSSDIRQTFLQFFARNGHEIVASSPLVPANDPTLLFTNAGMVQFKDTFLGLEQRPYKTATTSQKSMRVSGKHNDLENVGPSPRHHTFFEMLGNFSFGDYFKREAIQYAWDLLTKDLKLPVDRLWFSVFEGDENVPADEEAARLWEEVGAPRERILRFSAKDNFWQMGDVGPCGPCSEIHFYQGDHPESQVPEGVNSDDDDYMEIWNLVFMQYNRDAEGNLTPLPRPSIDTGMGFERIVSVLQGVRNNYETDLFVPIIERLIELVGGGREHYQANRSAYHAIADHSRACSFLIADGMRPGNEGRNYVLRRILRRAAYQGQTIGLIRPFLAETADVVIQIMGDAYPELVTKADYIKQVITGEEERFGRTLQSGLEQLELIVGRMQAAGQTIMAGDDAFRLHDTFGFPPDLTAKILHERGLGIDEAGYQSAREAQQQRAREARQFKRGSQAEFWAEFDLPTTEFTGYGNLQSSGSVIAIAVEGAAEDQATEGEEVQIVLDRSCFYGESGGQVGDTGVIVGPQGSVRVTDVQKPIPGLYVHYGTVERGLIRKGDATQLVVDAGRRRDIMRNHTATHLLHRALRDVLGEHAEQAGSLVAPDRLRFDFGHPTSVTAEELREIERRVNAWVRADTEVMPAEMSMAAAKQLGATALFGEKYGDVVRVVTVGCAAFAEPAVLPDTIGAETRPEPNFCSRELCGGTHVERTGEIGFFRIIGESSIGSGLRRIEAVTGRGAEDYVETQATMLRDTAQRLGVTAVQIPERIDQLLRQIRQQQEQLAVLQRKESASQLQTILETKQQENGVALVTARVDAPNIEKLREMGDWLRDKLGSGVVVLGTVLNEKPQLLAMVTSDLVKQGYHAGNLVKALAQVVGGGGGGRPDVASAGGRDVAKLDEALSQAKTVIGQQKK
ncbi:MAG TPA: alanine--tRNA ligase [Herpetosiphonaceae bacterium]